MQVAIDEFRMMLTDPNPDIRWKARMLVLMQVAGYVEGAAKASDELDAMLADPDPVVRRRAGEVRRAWLQGELRDHVQVVLEVLADDTAVDAWSGCVELLAAVAPSEEFGRLVTVLAKTTFDGLGDRLATALGLTGRDLPRFTTEQAGQGASVTCWSCTPDATGPEGGGGASHTVPTAQCSRVSALVALLGSRHEQIRHRAVEELAELGPGVAGVLRTACRSRMPARRGALAALAEIGWHELDPADYDLLTRLVRSRQPAESPAPLGPPYEWAAEWYSIPTTDQAAVLDAFDLCDPVPATMRMGLARWSREDGWRPGDRAVYGQTLATFEQVYVSPALDGWTLVFADYPTLDGGGAAGHRRARAADALHRCWQLSHRFGAAHWYAQGLDGYSDHSGWCVCERGEVVRYCYYHPASFDLPPGEVLVGPTSLADLGAASLTEDLRAWLAERDTSAGRPPVSPPPKARLSREEAEARIRALFGDEADEAEPDEVDDEPDEADDEPDEADDENGWPDPTRDWEFSVSRVAWRLSVSPESFGPDMRVTGTGVLAVPRALRNRPRYGALPV
ncbi:hypothetical protein [Nocardia africana]